MDVTNTHRNGSHTGPLFSLSRFCESNLKYKYIWRELMQKWSFDKEKLCRVFSRGKKKRKDSPPYTDLLVSVLQVCPEN